MSKAIMTLIKLLEVIKYKEERNILKIKKFLKEHSLYFKEII